MTLDQCNHDTLVVEQFSKQAIPFAQVPGHLDGIEALIALAEPRRSDVALDIACGPGLVTCAFAPKVAKIEGIDITPQMIDEARKRQEAAALTNMSWRVGSIAALPYADDSFDLIVTRYSFHHFTQPRQALAEMLRVCRPGGMVLIADVVMAAGKAEAYDRLELIRDPSHTRILRPGEMDAWFAEMSLVDSRQAAYEVAIGLEQQLVASFPGEAGRDEVRRMVTEDIGVDAFGICARRESGEVRYTVPISAFVGRKPG